MAIKSLAQYFYLKWKLSPSCVKWICQRTFSKKHGKCQRTYIYTNKARSMKEIPEQLSVRATIKKELLPHSKPNIATSIYHMLSPNATALHLFITAMRCFFLASLCISNCWFPCRVTQRAEELPTPDVSLPRFYVHVSLVPEGQCNANVSSIPCCRCEEM